MSDIPPRAEFRRIRVVAFGVGAAVGSAVGLVLGSLLAHWLGNGMVSALQTWVRRITGRDDHPNWEVLLQ
jgi:hypothetical protein